MVREIVSIQVGLCGNHIGSRFWRMICGEHKLSLQGELEGVPEQIDKRDVYFQEKEDTLKYVPRSVLIDLEPSYLEEIKASPLNRLFKPDNFIFAAVGAGNNWCKGHYTEGAEIVDECMDVIRKEVEACDCLQGFQLAHSLGGGTGSGLGTLILLKCRDEYPDRINATFTVYPSPKVSDVVVEPYNATLAMHQLLENSDETFVLDNEALFDISQKLLGKKKPTYAHLNWVISMVMSGVTSSMRFGGELNSDLRKLGVNLVPFPRLHFFTCSQAPIFVPSAGKYLKLSVQEITEQLWSRDNTLASIDTASGKYMTASFLYRSHGINSNLLVDGFIRKYLHENHLKFPTDVIDLLHKYASGFRGASISTEEVENMLARLQDADNDRFVSWIPGNMKTSIVGAGPSHTPLSGTLVANTTAIKGVFSRINQGFQKMFRRKAFLHWYKGEGMDSMEFEEAEANNRDLVTEFQDKEDVVVDLTQLIDEYYDYDEDGDEEDEEDEEEESEGDF